MRKFFSVFWFEYRRNVFSWSFLVDALLRPLSMVLLFGLIALMMYAAFAQKPVGYVDQAGIIPSTPPQSEQTVAGLIDRFQVQLTPLATEAQAQAALDAGKIQAYYLLPPDFRQVRAARLVYRTAPTISARERFEGRLRRSLLADLPPQRLNRLLGSPIQVVISLPQSGDEHYGLGLLRLALPGLLALMLFMSYPTAMSTLIHLLNEEKAGRVIEILVTSISPVRLMLAKITALLGIGMTQMIFSSTPPLLVAVVLGLAGLSLGQVLPFGLATLVLLGLICLFSFLFMAVLVMLISVLATSASEARKSFFPLYLIMLYSPFFASKLLLSQPDHWLTYLLSFFPITSPFTVLFRLAFTTVPVGQLVGVCLFLLLASLALTWLTGRIFQAGMLQSSAHIRLAYLLRVAQKGTE